MTEMTRWNLEVSSSTDADVRAFLTEQGQSDGDLARFVEEAVKAELFWQTIDEVHARNAHLNPDEVMQMVNEEIAAHRAERRAAAQS